MEISYARGIGADSLCLYVLTCAPLIYGFCSKCLDAGKWKVEVKSKTESGTKFKATTVNNTEKSVTQSGLETEFAWPDYGNSLHFAV